jgi:nucleotide-binding universal stress UspA family protein
MFSKIIVGVDGFDGGRDALALAKNLAGKNASLVLTTVFPYEHQLTLGPAGGFAAVLRDEAERELEANADGDARCRVQAVADASPARALHAEAEREAADLIVVGSCHRGAIGGVVLGDVARATLHGAPCPVAVAPHGYRPQSGHAIRTIGVGFNGSDQSKAALDFAAKLARTVGGNLRIVSAVQTSTAMASGYGYAYAYDWSGLEADNRHAAAQELEEAAAGLDLPVETEIVAESAGIALEHLSERVDVVVAGSRGWGATHRVVLGSTTDHLAHHASSPVIVVPSPVAARKSPTVAPQPAHA